MTLTSEQQQRVDTIANKHRLKFVILHGSYATGKQRPDSDLDIAVLGKEQLDYKEQLQLYGAMSDIFGDNSMLDKIFI